MSVEQGERHAPDDDRHLDDIACARDARRAAQDWPTRPMTLVVPFAAGGGVDVSARIQAQRMGELLGQTIVVENVGAAAGMTGGQRVAKAAPDGYTFLIGNTGTHAYNQSALQEAALQCRDRLRAGRAGVGIAAHPDRAQGPAGEQSPGVHRLHRRRTRARCSTAPPASAPARTCPARCSTSRSASTSRTCPIAAKARRCRT